MSIARVSSVSAATRALEDAEFDAVLLDLGLPDSDGLAAIIASRPQAASCRSLSSRPRTTKRSPRLAVHRGAQDYLVKSRTGAELLQRSIRYARERAEWRRDVIRREAELRQAQKMEAVGRLAGGVAHDFNNVLTAIFGYADLLLEQFAAGRLARAATSRRSGKPAERAAALTRQLLAFSRKQVMQPRVLDLNDVVVSLAARCWRG